MSAGQHGAKQGQSKNVFCGTEATTTCNEIIQGEGGHGGQGGLEAQRSTHDGPGVGQRVAVIRRLAAVNDRLNKDTGIGIRNDNQLEHNECMLAPAPVLILLPPTVVRKRNRMVVTYSKWATKIGNFE